MSCQILLIPVLFMCGLKFFSWVVRSSLSKICNSIRGLSCRFLFITQTGRQECFIKNDFTNEENNLQVVNPWRLQTSLEAPKLILGSTSNKFYFLMSRSPKFLNSKFENIWIYWLKMHVENHFLHFIVSLLNSTSYRIYLNKKYNKIYS